MSLKRQIAYPIVFFLLLILMSLGLIFLISYVLPGFLESKIISNLKKNTGISEFTLDFRELDLEGANLGPLRLGAPQHPALVIRSIQVDYSPGELYRKRIKKVTADGVELYCEFKNGQLGFRGFDLEKFLAELDSARTKNKTPDNLSYPSIPQRIEINNGTLICIVKDRTYRVPFEIDMSAEENAEHILKTVVRMYPRGQALKISARIDLEQNRIASQFAAEELDLLRFADMFAPIDGLGILGLASLEAKADFLLAPFRVSSVTGRIKGSALNLSYKSLKLQNISDPPDIEKPLIIEFQGPHQHSWNVKLSEFAAAAPIAANVSDMAATIHPAEGDYKITANFKLRFGSSDASSKASAALKFEKPFDLPLKFSGQYAKDGKWRFHLTNADLNQSGLRSAAFEYEQIHISTKFPGVNLTGNGAGGNISIAYKLQIPDVHITTDVVDIFVPKFVLKGKTDLVANQSKHQTSIIDLNLPGTAMILNSSRVKLNNLGASGKLQRNKNGAQEIAGSVRFANTSVEAAQGNIKLKQAQGKIPLKFPAGNSEKKGSISIASVSYQGLDLGAINAELQQTVSGISFSGKLKSQLIPELSAKFFGKSGFLGFKDYKTSAQFELFYPETGPEINLEKFLPAAEGFTFEGKFLEQGSLVVGKDGVYAAAESSLSNGKLRHKKNKILIEGIQMALLIPNLPKMRSAPGQKLKFSRASIGDMKIENGEIDFQIESTRSILIEKSHFNWCDGKVDAPAIRFTSGIEDYSLILYCDRLNLAKVLEQFGAASVEAIGELSGKIPLRYKNGQLSFHDGFLFTTPGEIGKIRMLDTEILTAGIPPDTPQYVQMELARKALEDYDYSWAKLNLTTEGEDLLLNMQLDGKPAKSLPFVYQKDIGGFAKVEAGIEGSTFQGIRLDVNFRLPLNKIMQYRELIQMIQKSRE
jgi:hypothetical protein